MERENNWIFPRDVFMKGQPPAWGDDTAVGVWILSGKGDDGMIGKKLFGLAAVFLLLLVIAAPVTAAEKTIQLNIPGCHA
ncbi:MAG: hypothetical protein C0390_00695 [Syntrophus sp. (in: bacteria)]|nr:hypothetical protein [Syntrophus sp. (in: bacteria)]